MVGTDCSDIVSGVNAPVNGSWQRRNPKGFSRCSVGRRGTVQDDKGPAAGAHVAIRDKNVSQPVMRSVESGADGTVDRLFRLMRKVFPNLRIRHKWWGGPP
jgi:hypothetical protein